MNLQLEQVTDKQAWDAHKAQYLNFRDTRYASVPIFARVPYKRPNTIKANSITSGIQDFITWIGAHCNRIQSQGQYDPRSGSFRRGMTKRGTSDLIAVVNGLSLHIEIKTTDRQSDAQKIYQAQVERAGAKYVIVHSFPEFYRWFLSATNTTHEHYCNG